jgi:glycosyltransferase involved in cell wall biosynthesis
MNVLILGTDRTVFLTRECFGDTRKRHIAYARKLRERCGEDSQIRYVSYSPASPEYQTQELSHGLTLYPTRSFHRATFVLDIVRVLPAVLKNWQPDLITVQDPEMLGFVLSRLLSARYLPQVHVNIFGKSWRTEHWSNPLRFFVAGHVLRRADGVRVVSQDLKEIALARGGIRADRIWIAPVGVNFTPADPLHGKDYYKARIAPDLTGRKTVLFVGRFVAQKNLELWVDVAETVACSRPDVGFVMAGDGRLLAQIKEKVKAKKLEDRFYFLGSIAHERLPEIYAAADTFLLTSDYEGYGRVIVEAFLAAVPVVSTRSTGPADLIRHGVDGYLAPVGSHDALSECILKLLASPENASRMGEAGKQRMVKEFSLEALVERLIDCWIGVCDTRRPDQDCVHATGASRRAGEQL